MEVVYECCGGLDVHAKTVVACVIKKGRKAIRTFATMTEELLHLGDWLSSEGRMTSLPHWPRSQSRNR